MLCTFHFYGSGWGEVADLVIAYLESELRVLDGPQVCLVSLHAHRLDLMPHVLLPSPQEPAQREGGRTEKEEHVSKLGRATRNRSSKNSGVRFAQERGHLRRFWGCEPERRAPRIKGGCLYISRSQGMGGTTYVVRK